MHRLILSFLLTLALAPSLHAQPNAPTRRAWTIDGTNREALVYIPSTATTNPTPVIFVYHGHSGTMQYFAKAFPFHKLWPEAIVVYPQGLPTPGRLTDTEGKLPGWQFQKGDHGDRDLKFFDAMFASLDKEYKIDKKRVYVTGHSNGGSFTYLLWAARGDLFAAVAPSSTLSLPANGKLKPKPVLHVAGETDPLVKFAWQKETMNRIRQVNECGEGQPWGDEKYCTLYPSKIGAPVVTFIHPGGHHPPSEVPGAIVKFFKENPGKE